MIQHFMKFHRPTLLFALLLVSVSLTPKTTEAAVEFYSLTNAQYQNTFDTWVPLGYRPVTIQVSVQGGQPLYYLKMEKVNGPRWVARHNLTVHKFRLVSQQLETQGFDIKIVQLVTIRGTQYYTAYWELR